MGHAYDSSGADDISKRHGTVLSTGPTGPTTASSEPKVLILLSSIFALSPPLSPLSFLTFVTKQFEIIIS